MRHFLNLTALILGLLLSTAAAANNFEYMAIKNTSYYMTLDRLNELGAEGWELVACPVNNKKEDQHLGFYHAWAERCILKRKIAEPIVSN